MNHPPLPRLGSSLNPGAIGRTRNGLLRLIGATETNAKGAKPSQNFYSDFFARTVQTDYQHCKEALRSRYGVTLNPYLRMLDRINTVGKILALSIPEIECIINESSRPVPDLYGYIDYDRYHRDLEEGLITIAFQVFAIEQRLATPYNQIRDPPRPIHVPRTKAICQEHRKLHRCLRIFQVEIDERHEYLESAQDNEWHQRIF